VPRDDAIIFSDLIGKLDMLRIECPKCGRSGRYRFTDLITRYGRDEKLFPEFGRCVQFRAKPGQPGR
jgi:hypothetical protein